MAFQKVGGGVGNDFIGDKQGRPSSHDYPRLSTWLATRKHTPREY